MGNDKPMGGFQNTVFHYPIGISMEYRRMLITLALLSAVVLCLCLSGCQAQYRHRELTLSDFESLYSDMDLKEVFEKVGWSDRSFGFGFIEYQYDLVDGRVVVLFFSGGQLRAEVQEKDGTWTVLKLAERPKEPAVWRIGKWVLLAIAALGVGYGVWRWRRQRQKQAGQIQ